MLDHRNILSHTYDSDPFEKAVLFIRDRYFPALTGLHEWLMKRERES